MNLPEHRSQMANARLLVLVLLAGSSAALDNGLGSTPAMVRSRCNQSNDFFFVADFPITLHRDTTHGM
jgi:hypothetical protein